jgi:hypothetical protein
VSEYPSTPKNYPARNNIYEIMMVVCKDLSVRIITTALFISGNKLKGSSQSYKTK